MNTACVLTYTAQVTFQNQTKRGKIHHKDSKKYELPKVRSRVTSLFSTPLRSTHAGYSLDDGINYSKNTPNSWGGSMHIHTAHINITCYKILIRSLNKRPTLPPGTLRTMHWRRDLREVGGL